LVRSTRPAKQDVIFTEQIKNKPRRLRVTFASQRRPHPTGENPGGGTAAYLAWFPNTPIVAGKVTIDLRGNVKQAGAGLGPSTAQARKLIIAGAGMIFASVPLMMDVRKAGG
jgi:hypothetical protein